MFKRSLKRFISVLLTLCLIVPVITIGTVSTSANVIADFAIEKLLDTGMRVASEAVDALGEATGNEDVEEAFSFINDWVFKDASEVAAEKTQELCEEILTELTYVEGQITSGDSAISGMIADDFVNNAKTALSNQWSSDVDHVLSAYNADQAFDQYYTYMWNGVHQTGTAETDLRSLMYEIRRMSKTGIDTNQSEDAVKEQIFTDSTIIDAFESLIHDLASKLDYSDPSTSVAQCAAKYAYLAYPFSHQQYPYVHSMMEKQIMYLIQAEMLYNEYLFQQGEYLKNSPAYGVDSIEYAANQNAQKYFYEVLMNDSVSGSNAKIAAMLDKSMNVALNGSLYISLDDYMKPEDAGTIKLSVEGYESSHDFYKEICNVGNTSSISGIRDGSNKSSAKYTKSYMLFKKVMTHTAAGNKVFYILDPEQFSGTDALYI